MIPSSEDFEQLILEARNKYAEGNINHAIDCIEEAVHVTIKKPSNPDANAAAILDVVRMMMEDNNDDAAAACLLNVNANLQYFSPEVQALICLKSGECYLSSQSFEHALNKFEQSRKIIEGCANMPQIVQAELALARSEALRQSGRAELAFVQLLAAYELYEQLNDITTASKIKGYLREQLRKIDHSKRAEFLALADKVQDALS
ncbi:MAG TPA: hypothetical protein V6C76_06820 [Drouetiella sp.]